MLRNVARLQRQELSLFEKGIEREDLMIDLAMPFAIIISGIRRSGKSTFMRQLMQKVKGFYYFNLEDSRLADFKLADFEKLDKIFHEEWGEQEYYFFDEIQNIPEWERFVRRLVDIKKHIMITGSNASLLSHELGTKLTGRHLTYEMFPFSFKEYLAFHNYSAGIQPFDKYLLSGGFPEYIKSNQPDVLQELLKDILARDITSRYNIRNQKALKELASYLLTNIGKKFTYNSLKKIFNFGSVNSIISFVNYFEDTYTIFTIPRFDYSMKKILVSPKKVYSVDNGLSQANSSSFFDDKGRLLENLVYITLRRKNKEIFYFQDNNECDFLVKERAVIVSALQVCYEINEDNKGREIGGLVDALIKFKLKEGLVLTYNQTDEFDVQGKKIKLLPVWKWLLMK